MNRPGPLIAEGATAEIYAWGADAILKLYRRGFPAAEAEREARQIEAVRAAGIKTPAVLQQVELDGRAGLVLQRVRGRMMMDAMVGEPERAAHLAEQMAELHAVLHTRIAPNLPHKHDRLRQQIEAAPVSSAALKQMALARLEQLAREDALCHGDFHPGNILLTEEDPVIIDWVDATQGPPAADLTRTRLLTLHSALPPTLDSATRQQLEAVRQHFFTQYMRRYQEIRTVSNDELDQWALPIAVARLSEGLGDAEHHQLEAYCISLIE